MVLMDQEPNGYEIFDSRLVHSRLSHHPILSNLFLFEHWVVLSRSSLSSFQGISSSSSLSSSSSSSYCPSQRKRPLFWMVLLWRRVSLPLPHCHSCNFFPLCRRSWKFCLLLPQILLLLLLLTLPLSQLLTLSRGYLPMNKRLWERRWRRWRRDHSSPPHPASFFSQFSPIGPFEFF